MLEGVAFRNTSLSIIYTILNSLVDNQLVDLLVLSTYECQSPFKITFMIVIYVK